VDHCHACGGIWLEVATLSELMELSVDRLEDWTGKLAALVFDGAQQVAGDVLCPTCHLRLDERAYAASGDVYVDRCVSCRGTWLDNGELVAIRRISIEQDVWGQAL
jgi:Zn-finger nucleic acid-binding protein